MTKQEAQKIREAILMVSKHLPDNIAVEVPKLFARAEKGKAYKKGDRVFDSETGKLVKLNNDIVMGDRLPERALSRLQDRGK